MAAPSKDPVTDVPDDDEGDQYIQPGEVYEEVQLEGDAPMDEDDDDDPSQAPGEGDEEMGDVVMEDSSIQHFPNHNGSVFSVSLHPTQPLAASGGEDDLGYIWDITPGEEVEQIAKLEGHTDSVTSTEWSQDGELLATGGMDGKIRVWKRVGEGYKKWEFLIELTGPDEVMWMRWHPRGTVLLAGSNDSMVWLWQLPTGATMQVFAGHEGPVQAGQFTPDGKRIVTASADGSLILWDPRSPKPVFKLTGADARFGLDAGITSLAVNPASTLAVVGGAEGGVRVVSLSKGEVVGALEGHSEGESIEAVAFVELTAAGSTGGGVVVTAGTDGKACVWDLATMRLRTTLTHSDAITSLLPHPAPKAHIVTTASSDRTLKTWDARTGSLLKEHKGHQAPILAAGVGRSSDGSTVVVSAGDDGVCLVFATE